MRITEEEAKRRLSSSRNLASLSAKSIPQEVPFSDDVAAPNSGAPNSAPESTNSPSSSGSGSLSSNQISGNISHELIQRGRTPGSEGVPERVRDQIAMLASMPGADIAFIATQFGVSQTAVSQYKTGRVGNKPPNESRAAKVQERQEAIKDVALDKLMGALGLLTDEKMAELTTKEIGRFANDMARVVTAVSPAASAGPPINFIVYTPESHDESKYKTIDVG